jgi:hypothetical protein
VQVSVQALAHPAAQVLLFSPRALWAVLGLDRGLWEAEGYHQEAYKERWILFQKLVTILLFPEKSANVLGEKLRQRQMTRLNP